MDKKEYWGIVEHKNGRQKKKDAVKDDKKQGM